MNKFVKFAAAGAMTGVLALALASPSEARSGRNAAAAIGFGAGMLAGAAIANSSSGYYGGGYYEPGYAYEPSYAYEPRYAPRYAPAFYDAGAVPAYPTETGPRYYQRSRGSRCGGSPASPNYRPCN